MALPDFRPGTNEASYICLHHFCMESIFHWIRIDTDILTERLRVNQRLDIFLFLRRQFLRNFMIHARQLLHRHAQHLPRIALSHAERRWNRAG